MLLALIASCSGEQASGDDGGDDPDMRTCTEAWECTPWTTDGVSDQGMRTCTDLNACGTVEHKPAASATLPALDPQAYECDVEPVLTRNCSMLGCHGTETGRAYRIYARGRLRITGQTITEPGSCSGAGMQHPSEMCIGGIECRCWTVPQLPDERRRSFDAARGFALDATGAPLADMAESELLRQPQAGGGFAHAGMVMWSAGDSEYTAVKSWLDGATHGAPCNSMN